jgi:hypothetical protein
MKKSSIILITLGFVLNIVSVKAQSTDSVSSGYAPHPGSSAELFKAAIKANRRNDSIRKIQVAPSNNTGKTPQTTNPVNKDAGNKPKE